jgi:hypothetical protein
MFSNIAGEEPLVLQVHPLLILIIKKTNFTYLPMFPAQWREDDEESFLHTPVFYSMGPLLVHGAG